MQVASSFSMKNDPIEAAREAYQALTAQLKSTPHMIFVHGSADYDYTLLIPELNRLAPEVPLHGGTSCLGIITHLGAHCTEGKSLGLFGILDPEGAYGAGALEISDSPRATATRAAEMALIQANRQGEVPTLVWVTSAPGVEEEVILGLEDLFGPHVRISGGTAADDLISGKWSQFANKDVFGNAVSVAVFFAPGKIEVLFQSGYEPTLRNATVTKGSGRTIAELDGEPAAKVYSDWLDGELTGLLLEGGNILMKTTLHPLGRIAGQIGGIPYYQLSHPESITATGALTLFTQVQVGEKIWLMQGSPDSLIERAEQAAQSAAATARNNHKNIVGAMVIYCAGCMLTIKDQMDQVVTRLKQGLGEKAPFLGVFTFGEQGCFLGGENRHGNLMFTLLVFLDS